MLDNGKIIFLGLAFYVSKNLLYVIESSLNFG